MVARTGSKLSRTTFKKLIRFPYPPLHEQQRIVANLDEAFAGLATATANAEKNLTNARELFDSLSQSIFEKGDGWQSRSN